MIPGLSYLGPGFFEELNAARNAPAPVPKPAVVDSSDEPVMNAVRARSKPAATKVTKAKSTKASTSCVYFIRNTINGLVKIGRTSSMTRRLQTLQTAVGDSKLIVENKVQMTPNRAKTLEKNIHVIFEKQRRNGEWFDVSSKSIDVFIRVLRNVYR